MGDYVLIITMDGYIIAQNHKAQLSQIKRSVVGQAT